MTDLSSLTPLEDIKRWKVENPLTDNRKQDNYIYQTTGRGHDDPYTIGAYLLLFKNASDRIPTEEPKKTWVIYNGEGDKSQVTYKGDVRWIHDKGDWGGTYTIQAHGYGIEYAKDGTYTGTFNNGKRSGIGQLLFQNSLTIGFLHEGEFLSNIKTDKSTRKSIFNLDREKKFYLEPYSNLIKVFGVNLKENIKTFIEKAENQAQIGLINFDNTIKDAEDKFDQLLCKPTETSTAVGVHNPNNQASSNICYEYKNTGEYGYTENENYTYFGNIKDGTPHGLGQITKTREYYNGRINIVQTTVSTGNFVNGKLTGFGEIKQIEGSKGSKQNTDIVFRYLGNFENDLLHGCGIKFDRGEYSWVGGYENLLYFSDNFVEGVPPKEIFMEKETNSLRPFWRGNNYYLVKKICKELYWDRQNDKVKNFFTLCEEVVKKAKETKENDIKTAETKTQDEIKEENRKKTEKQLANEQTAKFDKEKAKVNAADTTYQKIIHPLLDFKTLLDFKIFNVINTTDGEYKGSLSNKNNEPFGLGTMNFKNNDVYIGSFYQGKMHGLGQLIYNDKSVYRGQFKEGTPTGFGVLIIHDKKYYSDSFNGREYGQQLEVPTIKFDQKLLPKQQGNSLVPIEQGNSLVSGELHGQPLVTDNKDLFGKNVYLVVQIRTNIEKDVDSVLEKANISIETAVVTTNSQLQAQETTRLELKEENTDKLTKYIKDFTIQLGDLQKLANDLLVKPDKAINIPGLEEKIQSIQQTIHFLKTNNNKAKKQKLLSSNAKSAENKIIFYQDCNYEGNAWSVEDGTRTVKDDKISSIRVPAGKQVIIFRQDDTHGLTITKDTPCLTDIKDNNGKDFNDNIEIVISGDGTDNGNNGNGNGNGNNGTGTSFSKLALISAATAAATAGLYYAYKKYNKSAKKSSDKRSEPKRSETKRSDKRSANRKKSSETKRSETKRSYKRSAKRKRRSAKKSSQQKRRSA